MKNIARRLVFSQSASGLTSGIYTPFFGAWMAWQGLSAGQIAIVLSAGLLLRGVAGPITGVMADARNDRRIAMLITYWVILASYGVMTLSHATWLIMLAGIIATIGTGTAVPLLESVSVRLSERYGFDYGRVRIGASSAFVVANILSGLTISSFGFWTAGPWLMAGSALCVASTLQLPAPPAEQPHNELWARFKATFGEARELLRSGVFLLFLAAASFDQGSHAFYYGYGGLHWHALGYSGILIGVLWPLGVFAEIALFSQALRVLRVIGPTRLLLLSGLACVVRWTILAFDPPLPLVVFAQLLHGGTFAMAHLGAMYFMLRAVPPRLAATAQSLYFVTYSGLVMGLATLVSGKIYAAHGGRAYLVMSGMGAVAMVLSLILSRHWNGERIIHGAHEEHPDRI